MKRKMIALFIAVMMLTMCVTVLADEIDIQTEVMENEGDPTPKPSQEHDAEAPSGEPAEPARPGGGKASVTVDILGSGGIHIGDWVTLEATVKGVGDNAYSLRWECDAGSGWLTIEGETGGAYSFQVTTENSDHQWRAVLVY